MSQAPATTFSVERLGGAAGFGSAHLKSCGSVPADALSEQDHARLDALFAGPAVTAPAQTRPGERFRITRHGPGGDQTVTVSHDETPAALRSSVHDTLE